MSIDHEYECLPYSVALIHAISRQKAILRLGRTTLRAIQNSEDLLFPANVESADL